MDAAALAEFKEEGVVIVRGLIPSQQIDDWRAQVWDTMTLDADKPEEWGAGAGNRNVEKFKEEHKGRVHHPYTDTSAVADPFPLSPTVGEQPQVKAVLDQLLGENTYAAGIAAGPEQGAGLENEVVVFNWPSPPEERPAYQGSEHVCTVGHIEGYRGASKGGPTPQWMVGATFYLEDVAPGGGGTCVWPRSHRAVHRCALPAPLHGHSSAAVAGWL